MVGPCCSLCKYWERKHDESEHIVLLPSISLGACTRAIPFWDATEWVGEEVEDQYPDEWRTIRKLKPEYKGHRFFAQDGSDYKAVVLTTGDFHCADWKLKE